MCTYPPQKIRNIIGCIMNMYPVVGFLIFKSNVDSIIFIICNPLRELNN